MKIWGVNFLLYCLLLFPSCDDKQEKLLVSGCGWKQVSILDKASGKIEWTHPLQSGEDCNDVELTTEGNILYAYTTGARLINRQQEILWDFKADEKEELYTATQLTDGKYLLALCGNPSRIIELSADGKPIYELTFDTSIADVHSQFRQIVKTPENTYLIPLMGRGEVIEMSRQGEVLKRIPCGGTPFSVQILTNGNWLVSCGDGHKLEELNPRTGQSDRTVQSGQLEGDPLLFVAEAIRYPNGNTLISNWNGHTNDKTQPLLLEIDSLNETVWELPHNPEIVNISTVYSFFE